MKIMNRFRALLKVGIIMLTVLIKSLSLVAANVDNQQISDSVLQQIGMCPEAISSYTTCELTEDMNQERIKQWCKLICSLRSTSIRRSTIKSYYFPLCREIILSYMRESYLLREMAKGRVFLPSSLIQTDSICIGKEIESRFMEYQQVCMVMMNLPIDNLDFPWFYGDLRMFEFFLWGNNEYMDNLDRLPIALVADINNLFGMEITSLEKDLYKLLLAHKQDTDFLTDNAALLLNTSTYLSQHQMGIVVGFVCEAFIRQDKKQEFLDLVNSIFSKRWGREFWAKIKPIMNYRFTGILEVEKIKSFQLFRDSLLSERVAFANYFPHECPEGMKHEAGYAKYNDMHYAALDYMFTTFIRESSISPQSLNYQFFNPVGCNTLVEFLKVYTNETLRRYYDDDDFLMWGKIEQIREYLETSPRYPIDIALHIAECYAPINAPIARDFIRKTSLDVWINKQINLSPQNVDELGLRAASVIAYVYASLYNEKRYPDILRYVKWVDTNLERAQGDKDGIVYNIASALMLMDKHKESLDWISKVKYNSSEYKQEFYNLIFVDYCKLGETKEANKIISKMSSVSYQDNLRMLLVKLEEGKRNGLGDLLSSFTCGLSYDFNLFPFMNLEDQDWSVCVAKKITNDLFSDLDVSLWVEEEMNGKQTFLYYEPYFAAMMYNWALASKGVLLRSNKYMGDLILNKMPDEQYRYYRQALVFDVDDYPEDNLKSRMDYFVSEQAKIILLDYIRKDTTHMFPQFDFNIVRNQLETGDIAIELLRRDYGIFDVVMICKDWEFPKRVSLIWNDNENNSKNLWTILLPYLTDVKRIYIALDGEFFFENIEYFTDSTGITMNDRFSIYRVSTTLNIPKDVYISDIQNAVVYGNLNYADLDEIYSKEINEGYLLIDKKERGAYNDCWIPLEETKEELKAIFSIFRNVNIQFKDYQGVLGDKMSFMALNHQKTDLLHLATHGFYHGEDLSEEGETSAMKRSGLALSNSAYDISYTKQSGSVFANEIANMDLTSVKLLVLSACETAKGKLGDDGVFGLQRGFKQAGVGCMIMSLKEVNSQMTTELMRLFYSYFAKGQSVREAFKNAQRQIATKYKIDNWKYFVIID